MKKIIRLTENDLARIVKRIIKETESPELECDWFISDTTLLDGVKGELHFTEKSKGFWYVQKFSNVSDDTDFTEATITIPQLKEIEVEWDEDEEKIKLVNKSLDGLDAYNKLHNTNYDAYSCKLLFASESYPSNYGVSRSQYIHSGEVFLIDDENKPKTTPNEVKLQDGAVIAFDVSYYVDKKLFKKSYKFLSMSPDESFNRSLDKCDKYDMGRP
jgi:hypothetical protein